ncbi:MAG: hypothetical protein R3B91_16050 [Planctomycetaceae bacterium]
MFQGTERFHENAPYKEEPEDSNGWQTSRGLRTVDLFNRFDTSPRFVHLLEAM